MEGNIRRSAVAGSFYPSDKKALAAEVERHLKGGSGKQAKAIGVISPHAGYMYSGHVAGAVFGSVVVPRLVVIIGPNHRGIGAPAAVDDSSGWEFPFGVVPVDGGLSDALVNGSKRLEYDSSAHLHEHSLEVVVPFLHARNPDVSMAAVCLRTQDEQALMDVSRSVAGAARDFGALIVASTDMTHYLPDAAAREIDGGSAEVIMAMDGTALLKKVRKDHSLCGGGAVSVLLWACAELGAREATLVRYATSGDVSGTRDEVVGYGGFTFSA